MKKSSFFNNPFILNKLWTGIYTGANIIIFKTLRDMKTFKREKNYYSEMAKENLQGRVI